MMLRYRVIPILLLQGPGLVKTVKFKNPVYIGDPINAVKIFNEKEIDELVFLDIRATIEDRKPNFVKIKEIAEECFMPLGYGGGINSLDDIKIIFDIGIEKVILNSIIYSKPNLISEAASIYGSQSIVVSIDVRKSIFNKYNVYSHGGRISVKSELVDILKMVQDAGAGEVILTSIDRDGTMAGYDLELIKKAANLLSIPLVSAGGAGHLHDFVEAIKNGYASAVAAGAMFVFQGVHRAVLISYPKYEELEKLLN